MQSDSTIKDPYSSLPAIYPAEPSKKPKKPSSLSRNGSEASEKVRNVSGETLYAFKKECGSSKSLSGRGTQGFLLDTQPEEVLLPFSNPIYPKKASLVPSLESKAEDLSENSKAASSEILQTKGEGCSPRTLLRRNNQGLLLNTPVSDSYSPISNLNYAAEPNESKRAPSRSSSGSKSEGPCEKTKGISDEILKARKECRSPRLGRNNKGLLGDTSLNDFPSTINDPFYPGLKKSRREQPSFSSSDSKSEDLGEKTKISSGEISRVKKESGSKKSLRGREKRNSISNTSPSDFFPPISSQDCPENPRKTNSSSDSKSEEKSDKIKRASGDTFVRAKKRSSASKPLSGRGSRESNIYGDSFYISEQRLSKNNLETIPESNALAAKPIRKRSWVQEFESLKSELYEAQARLLCELSTHKLPLSKEQTLGYDEFKTLVTEEEQKLPTAKKRSSPNFFSKGRLRCEKERINSQQSLLAEQLLAVEKIKEEYDSLMSSLIKLCLDRNTAFFEASLPILAHNFQLNYPIGHPHPMAWNNFDDWSMHIVCQFPQILSRTGFFVTLGPPPLVENFNNYGLIPDSESILKDSSGTVLAFKLWGDNIFPAIEDSGLSQAIEKEGLIFFKHNEGAIRYHDNVLATYEEQSFLLVTLCDGTGQSHSAKAAADVASKTAHELGVHAIQACQTLHGDLLAHFASMKQAQLALMEHPEAAQGTTFLQASVKEGILSGVAVGDSKAFVFTANPKGGWICRDMTGESRESLDPRDSGGRLSGMQKSAHSYDVEMANMRAFAYKLLPGDIIYLCSDGGYDNFDPSQLCDKENTPLCFGGEEKEWEPDNLKHLELANIGLLRNLEKTVAECQNVKEMFETIVRVSQERTVRDKLYFITTPLKEMAIPPKVLGQGKGDDMAMVLFQYLPKTNS